VDADDAARLQLLGVSPGLLRVTGDPRVDSILDRVSAVPASEPLLGLRDGHTLVAGSTWREDEEVVLAAFAAVRVRHPEARLILVPHEPNAVALEQIARTISRLGLPDATRLERPRAAPLVLVDRMGVLATLYGAGIAAYVGGGFGRSGLHSVLEPAAWQAPVLFGPAWRDNRDAAALVAHDGGVSVAGPDALAAAWLAWLDDDAARAGAGRRASEVVQRERGAASRSALMLEELLPRRE
jgi:3-deoxy-D-manno-octulosonic-acid transferase